MVEPVARQIHTRLTSLFLLAGDLSPCSRRIARLKKEETLHVLTTAAARNRFNRSLRDSLIALTTQPDVSRAQADDDECLSFSLFETKLETKTARKTRPLSQGEALDDLRDVSTTIC